MRVNVSKWNEKITLNQHTVYLMSKEYQEIAKSLGYSTFNRGEGTEIFTFWLQTGRLSASGRRNGNRPTLKVGWNVFTGEILTEFHSGTRQKCPKVSPETIEEVCQYLQEFYTVMAKHDLLLFEAEEQSTTAAAHCLAMTEAGRQKKAATVAETP